MSANSSAKPLKRRSISWRALIGYPLLVMAVVIGVQVVLILVLKGLLWLGLPLDQVNPAILNAGLAVVTYGVALATLLGVPRRLKEWKVSRHDLAFDRLPSWFDLLAGPLGFVPYIILSALLNYLAMKFLPWFDATQAQNTGFGPAHSQLEFALAFITLVILAPLAEELLFRGYLYGKLKKTSGYIIAMLITSLAFALLHGQWNVGLDVFCLSLVLCSLREITGSIWAGVILHMIKNGLAFYVLFVAPSLIQ